MIIVKEGAVWPPQPEDVEWSHASEQTLTNLTHPEWARVTELGSDLGAFLSENMGISATVYIANKLAQSVPADYRGDFKNGVRNASNIYLTQMVPEIGQARVAIHEECLVEVTA